MVEEVRSGGIRRGKVDPKHVRVRGTPKVEQVGDELSELECLEQVAHVGIASSSKLDAVGELIPTGKTGIRLHTSGDFRKVRSWLEPSIFEHFCRGSSS